MRNARAWFTVRIAYAPWEGRPMVYRQNFSVMKDMTMRGAPSAPDTSETMARRLVTLACARYNCRPRMLVLKGPATTFEYAP